MIKFKLIQEDFNTSAIQETKAAMKANKSLRMHERYQTILMNLYGATNDEIIKVTGLCLSSVYNYLKAYRESGIEGLNMNYTTGRPRKLTEEQENQVYKTDVEKTPSDVGFPAKMNWTSPLIRKWIEQVYDIRYSERGARELLYRLKLSFTTPTYTLAKADPVKQEAFMKAFEEIKKNS